MAGYADVEDPNALLAQDPGLSGGATVEEAISEAGFQVQAVNWVWEKVVGENLVESIITPITGDFEQIARTAAQWNNVRDALQATRNNLNAGIEELSPAWTGDAAQKFYDLIGTTWTLGIEADAQAAKLIGLALSKVADGSKAACDQILELIEKLVNKLIEAAAMLPIPVVGWGRAVKLVYDGIQLYNAIMDLIRGIQQMIEGAQQVIQGIQQVGTALSKLGQADSLNDLINVGNEAGQGIANVAGGAQAVRDGATQASSAAGDIASHGSSAADNARGLADERAAARDQGTDASGTTGNGDSRGTDGQRSDGESPNRPDDPETTKTPEEQRVCQNDPVDVASGEVVLGQRDVDLPGVLPLVLRRTHISSYRAGEAFGSNWASTLDQRLEFDRRGVVFVGADGVILVYPEVPADGGEVLPQTGPRWPLSRTDVGWAITQRETGQTLHFAAGENTLRRITAITDRNQNRIDIDRDPVGTPTAVRHHGGYHIDVDSERGRVTELRLRGGAGPAISLVRYRYHDSGLLAEVVNGSNQALRFAYDADGRLVQWTDRNGQWYRYLYDTEGRCVANQGSHGYLNGTFTYDRDNRTTRFTNALGHTTTYEFDERGHIVVQTDPAGHEIRQVWNAEGRLVGHTDELGRATRHVIDEQGNVTEIHRPDGSVLRADYNERGQTIRLVKASGAVTSYAYDDRGNRTSVTDAAGGVTRLSYDERGHLASVTDPVGSTHTITCDAAGLPISVTDPVGATVRYTRDPLGRVATMTDQTGAVTRYTWTVEGKPASRTDPGGATDVWRYDGEGNLVEHVDPTGARTGYEYAAFDLVTARIDADGARTTFDYDDDLRLTAVTNAQGRTWSYRYDPVGNLLSETDFNGRTVAYRYDAAGQLIERTNGAGQTVRYVRDESGRTVEEHADGTSTRFVYHEDGWLSRAAGDTAEVAFERDVLGNVLAETCNGHRLENRYDPLGRRLGRTTPAGVVSEYDFDPGGKLAALRTAGHTLDFSYDAAGREITRSLETGLRLSQSWAAGFQLTGQTLTAPPVVEGMTERTIQQRSFTYRADGVLVGIDDLLRGSQRYRLTSGGRVTALSGKDWNETYAYDSSGNLTQANWPAFDASAADAQGDREFAGTLLRRAGRTSYQHDEQGRVVRRTRRSLSGTTRTWVYRWDARDRLTEVTTPDGHVWRYRYDPLGRRIVKLHYDADGRRLIERTDFTWDHTVLAEQTHTTPGRPAETTTWDYQPGGNRALVQTETSGTDLRDAPQAEIDQRFYAIVTDLIGTPTELVDPGGAIRWHSRTTVWGAPYLSPRQATYCPLRFPGQYRDSETGLHYNYFRYYDPETARYFSPDPMGLEAAPNHHGYVHNPRRAADPVGLIPCDVADDLAAYREREGMPAAGSEEDQHTAARLDIDGQSYYGRNGHGMDVDIRVNAQTATHAEASVFQQAKNDGVTARHAALYVDRDFCQACGPNGGVGSLMRGLGVDTLDVHTPSGRYSIDATRRPSTPVPWTE